MSRFFILILVVQFFDPVNAQNNLPTTYLFDEPPTAIFAQTIYNDTIICVGTVFKEGDTIHYQQGAFIAFIDSCGNLIHYKKYFDIQGRDIFLNQSNKIIRTKDGGYCFIGSVDTEQLLLKTNKDGEIEFIKEYPIIQGFSSSFFLSIHEIQTSLYAVGYGESQNPYEDDLFMVKFDHEGNQLDYRRFYNPENCEYFQDAIVKNNNIVISTGQTNACVSGILKSRTRIFEVDTSGNLLFDWVDPSTNLKRGWGLGLKSTPDGGWIYAGAYNDTFIGAWQYNRLFVTKLDSIRNHEWTQVIGYQDIDGYNYFRDIAIDTEGNFIIAGQYLTGNPDFPDPNPATSAIVTKISPSGEILWTNIAKAYENGPGNGILMFTQNVHLLSSGNIIIGGYLYRFLAAGPQNEGWLSKLSPNGEVLNDPDPLCGFVSVQQPESKRLAEVRCYPNPTNDYFNIETLSELPYGSIWRLFDAFGRVVCHVTLPIQAYIHEVNIATLPSGIYCWELRTSEANLLSNGKIVKR